MPWLAWLLLFVAFGPPAIVVRAQILGHTTQFWDAATSGNFLWSAQATVSKGGASGDIIRLATNSLTLGTLAS